MRDKILTVAEVEGDDEGSYSYGGVDSSLFLDSVSEPYKGVDGDGLSVVEPVGNGQESSNHILVQMQEKTPLFRVYVCQIAQLGVGQIVPVFCSDGDIDPIRDDCPGDNDHSAGDDAVVGGGHVGTVVAGGESGQQENQQRKPEAHTRI